LPAIAVSLLPAFPSVWGIGLKDLTKDIFVLIRALVLTLSLSLSSFLIEKVYHLFAWGQLVLKMFKITIQLHCVL
jgi:hypothetical protein